MLSRRNRIVTQAMFLPQAVKRHARDTEQAGSVSDVLISPPQSHCDGLAFGQAAGGLKSQRRVVLGARQSKIGC